MKGELLSDRGRFGPLTADHPSVGKTCSLCNNELKVGDIPALIELGPADEENAKKEAAGQAFTAEAEIVHEDCAFKEETG